MCDVQNLFLNKHKLQLSACEWFAPYIYHLTVQGNQNY